MLERRIIIHKYKVMMTKEIGHIIMHSERALMVLICTMMKMTESEGLKCRIYIDDDEGKEEESK
jgi:hypothetical protein